MKKIVYFISVLSSLTVIGSSIFYLITRINITLLSQISSAIMIISLLYMTKIRYDKGQKTNKNWKLVLWIGSIGVFFSVISSFLSIFKFS